MLVGMSAANLQGIMASTIDVDIWIGLPARQYVRVQNICRKLKATVQSANKVYLADDTPVDFIYEVTGLKDFTTEYRRAVHLPFHGLKLPVLPLERICRSKAAAGRDKDQLHVLLIRNFLKSKKIAKPPSRRVKKFKDK
jgi:hypothetical protein